MSTKDMQVAYILEDEGFVEFVNPYLSRVARKLASTSAGLIPFRCATCAIDSPTRKSSSM